MKHITQQYEEEIKRLRFIYGTNKEEKIEQHIQKWKDENEISFSQRNHLLKFNKSLSEKK